VLIFTPAQISEKLSLRFAMQNRPITASLRQKQPRLKLAKEEYEIIRKRVPERDGWRCQECGSMQRLHVHHMKRKSQLG
jgi:hypothetical protein